MTKFFTWFVFLILLMPAAETSAQGIDFFHGPWKEALEKAKEEGKLIFVDAYTVWCGPCKMMSSKIFPQKEVGDFFNERFINVKMDMEKGDTDFRTKYPVSAYPTLFFIDPQGTIVKRAKGFRDAKRLIELARQALAIYDNIDEMDDLFAQGRNDAGFLKRYVKALQNAGKPTSKAVNEYLRRQKDLTTKENLLFIFNSVSAADSKVFDLLIQYRPQIEKLKSKEEVEKTIRRACRQTVRTAIEFEDEGLLNQAKAIMHKQFPAAAKEFDYEADLEYFAATKNVEKYLQTAKKYAKKVIKKDAEKLHELAYDSAKRFPTSDDVLDFAATIAEKAAKRAKDKWEYLFTYAQILAKLKKYDLAKKATQKAMKLAEDQGVPTGALKRFMGTLNAH